MNQEIIDRIKSGLKLISEQSFNLCEHEDSTISSTARKINTTAFELKKLMETYPIEFPDYGKESLD